MTIDFRVKAPIPGWEGLFAEGKRAFASLLNLDLEPTSAETLEQVIAEQDRWGIAHGVIMGRGNEPGSSNEELAAFLRSQPTSRFSGFIGIDTPDIASAVATIDKYAPTGLFRGVSLNPGFIQPRIPLDDPAWEPVYEASLRHGLPLSIVLSGYLGLLGAEPDYDFIRPSRLVKHARKYSDLKIIISHGAWPLVSEAIMTALASPNIYLSPDFYLGFPGSKLYVEAANLALSDRILYGSCYPNVPYDFAIQHFRKQEWNSGVLDKVLYENGAKLLGL
ncbi:amidohydrolase family protein [Cohnella fermenti]|uniref:Amidohydrolase-related domain-containing protein n=1 Tax=Cohnella fermenti TaxID=2565925 RepID=A0A4S4BLA3_9BACL|nr:amidohydrolase family protein [Cohnella fermenti]THF75341.1 hypothetical protein E6C55_22085 [Cohnella fermenti]